jgi:hypothetical protein
VKIGFEAGVGGIEQLTARDHHDVDALPVRRGRGLSKNFTDQPLCAVPLNSVPQLARCDNPKPGLARPVGGDHDRQEPSASPATRFEHFLELRSATEPARGGEAEGHRGGPGCGCSRQDEETVRRLRPFARRRLSTSRPFLVAILTRKPCVRLRRRRFGWNVRFMLFRPLRRTNPQRRNSNSSEPSSDVSIAGRSPGARTGLESTCCLRRWGYVTVASPAGATGCHNRPGGPSNSFLVAVPPFFGCVLRRFCGNPPKFSTTVEKNVEKPRFSPG